MQLPQASTTPELRRVGDYIGTVSSQGRVTIPEEVRRMLHIQPQDKLVFRVTEDSIEISGKLPTLEELAGSFTTVKAGQNLEEIIDEAKSDHYTNRFTRKMQL